MGGVRTLDLDQGSWRQVCPQGRLTWGVEGDLSPETVLNELDVLLTGGRLSPVARLAVRKAYEGANDGDRIEAAQQAIAMTAEFNTLGAPLPRSDRRNTNAGV